MEDIRNTTFGNISTNITNGNWDWDAGTVALKGLHALNSESIATSVSGSDPVDVTVTVSWHDLNGRVRSFNLRTYISS